MARIAPTTKRYPSDLTDEEWERIAPLMPKSGRRGPPREVEFLEVINAVRYLVRSGCAWRMLPVHFGHCERSMAGSANWHGVSFSKRSMMSSLSSIGERQGREASPLAAVIDSQSIKAPLAQARGYDAGNKILGRKRHIVVYTDRRLLMVDLTTVDMGEPSLRRRRLRPAEVDGQGELSGFRARDHSSPRQSEGFHSLTASLGPLTDLRLDDPLTQVRDYECRSVSGPGEA
ncbi:hypothetical protein LMG27198_01220 [Methylocystis echinoides]|uniref:Insertion element IS402-like domain-containing protein n=1 Tax=Methylocystis echinoides TaxID=29468 RepID=A0A9W6LPY1_9HYPH|nr:hypothetical protein LMG27198_01220 [Methylocystis echinoides]